MKSGIFGEKSINFIFLRETERETEGGREREREGGKKAL